MSYLFSFSSIKQNVLLSSYLDDWCRHKQTENEEKTEMQKSEYLENEKSFIDELKSMFRNYVSAIISWIKEK